MLGGAAMGGIAAAPLRAGMAVAEGYAGSRAGEEVGSRAERMGAPKGTAKVGAAVGGLVGGAGGVTKVLGALRGRVMGSAGAEAAAAAPAAGKVLQMPAPPSAAAGQAEEIAAKILSLRKNGGLSGAQITSALRQLYGIPPSAGQKMVDEVLASALLVKR
jgi:hypothetical protein